MGAIMNRGADTTGFSAVVRMRRDNARRTRTLHPDLLACVLAEVAEEAYDDVLVWLADGCTLEALKNFVESSIEGFDLEFVERKKIAHAAPLTRMSELYYLKDAAEYNALRVVLGELVAWESAQKIAAPGREEKG